MFQRFERLRLDRYHLQKEDDFYYMCIDRPPTTPHLMGDLLAGFTASAQVSPCLPSTPGAPPDDSSGVLPLTPGSNRDARRSSVTSSSTAAAPHRCAKSSAAKLLSAIPGSPEKTPVAQTTQDVDGGELTARRNLSSMFVEGGCSASFP